MKLLNQESPRAFYPYKPATLLQISGSDAAVFLQGQFTNDLRGLKAGHAVYGLWLNQKGKVLADSFVSSRDGGDGFFLMSYFSGSAVIRERLEAYVIADDVVIEDVGEGWGAVSVFGASAEELAAILPATSRIFEGRRGAAPSSELLFPLETNTAVRAVLSEKGGRELTAVEIEALRIANGIAAVPQDIGPTELPNEGRMEEAAISYTKGCYLGQEVMARLKSMGQVRRLLLRVEVRGQNLPALPAPLFVGERKIGELRSAIPNEAKGSVGLAVLSLLQLKSEVLLSFTPNGSPEVRVADPAFVL